MHLLNTDKLISPQDLYRTCGCLPSSLIFNYIYFDLPENHQIKLTGQSLVWKPNFREKAGENIAKQIAEVVTAIPGCFIWATENSSLSFYSSSEWVCLPSQDVMRIFHLLGRTIQLNELFKSLIITKRLLHPHSLAAILFCCPFHFTQQSFPCTS